MKTDAAATIPLTHIATITWSPNQSRQSVLREVGTVVQVIEEDVEVDIATNLAADPVIFLSFTRGPLVEFVEGGVVTFCRDATGQLVAWSGPNRASTPLGREIVDSHHRTLAAERREREIDLREKRRVSAGVVASSLSTAALIVAAMLLGGAL